MFVFFLISSSIQVLIGSYLLKCLGRARGIKYTNKIETALLQRKSPQLGICSEVKPDVCCTRFVYTYYVYLWQAKNLSVTKKRVVMIVNFVLLYLNMGFCMRLMSSDFKPHFLFLKNPFCLWEKQMMVSNTATV